MFLYQWRTVPTRPRLHPPALLPPNRTFFFSLYFFLKPALPPRIYGIQLASDIKLQSPNLDLIFELSSFAAPPHQFPLHQASDLHVQYTKHVSLLWSHVSLTVKMALTLGNISIITKPNWSVNNQSDPITFINFP